MARVTHTAWYSHDCRRSVDQGDVAEAASLVLESDAPAPSTTPTAVALGGIGIGGVVGGSTSKRARRSHTRGRGRTAIPSGMTPSPFGGVAPRVPPARDDIVFIVRPELGPSQSLMTLDGASARDAVLAAVGHDDHAAFEAYCFQSMIEREQEHHEDFVVFYHSYSAAALLYEIQAELARQLSGHELPDDFAPLPRIHRGPFDQFPELSMLRESFGSLKGQDHDPKFRALAISVSNSLFASGSEAPPLTCFRAGYSCMDLSFRGLLTSLLTTCGMSEQDEIEHLADQLADLAEAFDLQALPYRVKGRDLHSAMMLGGSGMTNNLRRGHMLQLFVHKDYCDDICYRSAPYGKGFADTFRFVDFLRGKHRAYVTFDDKFTHSLTRYLTHSLARSS